MVFSFLNIFDLTLFSQCVIATAGQIMNLYLNPEILERIHTFGITKKMTRKCRQEWFNYFVYGYQHHGKFGCRVLYFWCSRTGYETMLPREMCWFELLLFDHHLDQILAIHTCLFGYCSKFNPLRAIFFRGNINIYLHFVSFLHIDKTGVVEILTQIRQEPTYSTKSISWVLMSWLRKEPGQ